MMNQIANISKPSNSRFQWHPALLMLFTISLGALAVNSQSFWIDEACTATVAIQSSLKDWGHELLTMIGSETQMPLYMLYVWSWEKIFGPNEWWLRLSNLPWLALGLLAIPRRQTAFLLLVIFSPFVWFYLNEFRPYIMQASASLLLLGILWRLAETSSEPNQPGMNERVFARFFCFALLALSGSSLLGMIWAGAAWVTALVVLGWPRSLRLARQNAVVMVITSLALMALGGYYLWTLKRGNGASPGSTGMGNTLFSFYELFGFAGLGPGRNQLREIGLSAIHPFLIPLTLQTVVTSFVFLAGCKHVVQQVPRRAWLGVTATLGATVILLLAAGILKHFRVLGRHFAPLAPVLILLLAIGFRSLWSRGGWRRWLAMFFLLFSMASAVSLRFAGRHAKDDYRAAAAIAIAANANNEKVWWCADEGAGLYYNVPLSPHKNIAVSGKVWLASDPFSQLNTNQPSPDLLILSKPDIYDKKGQVQSYLACRHYIMSQTLSAFTLWRKDAK